MINTNGSMFMGAKKSNWDMASELGKDTDEQFMENFRFAGYEVEFDSKFKAVIIALQHMNHFSTSVHRLQLLMKHLIRLLIMRSQIKVLT
jgi:hypothetical protein